MMPYCPECGGEFEDGLASCPVCGCELEDDPEDEEKDDLEDQNLFENGDQAVLLYQTNEKMNIDLLEEALKDQGIPCLIRQNTGSFSGLGTLNAVYKDAKIFVPERALESALEVAETIIPDYERPDD